MWKLVEDKLLKLNSKLVYEFKNMVPLPGDRPQRKIHMQKIRKEIEAGRFTGCQWACITVDGITYRLNGGHTSNIMADLNGQRPDVSIHVQRYEGDSMEDAKILYATFDSMASVRHSEDIYRTVICVVPELAVMSKKAVNLAVVGLAYSEWLSEKAAKSPAERAELLIQNPKFGLWLNELCGTGKSKLSHILRSPVAAAMAKTFKVSQKDSTKFWNAVAYDVMLGSNGEEVPVPQPIRRLRDYLMTRSIQVGHNTGGKESASNREMMVKCIHAWNTWRDERKTEWKYIATSPVPPAI